MVGVGEMLATATVKAIVGRLTQSVIDQIARQWGYKDQVTQMVEKMRDLAAVMHDADDRLRRGEENGEAAGRWLMKLKSVAYDIEDVLDDLEVPNSQPKCLKLIRRITGPHKLDIVRKKIEELERENLAPRMVAHHEARPEVRGNNETYAATSRTGMVGRNIERDKVIKLLLSSEADEDISVIPIVGLGGIGKTTLAKSVCADERVKGFFHIQAWVYVSKLFDLQNIGFTIMKSLGININLEKCTSQLLHANLEKGLASTRYLIVLDDLWEEDGDKLEELKLMLQYGSKGSKIVVTTRNINVVRKLCVGNLANERKICPVPEPAQINLDILAPEHCWEVMKLRALGPRDHGRSDLEKIGMQIAHNCGGLPLVLSALGQVLSESRDVKKWEDIRDTKVDLRLEDGYQKKILQCLMPSYYYMKVDFKMCFTYLAVFPKGCVMNIDRVIQQWNALGYISPGYNGQICIDYLLGMSFLQVSGSALISPTSVHAKAPREVTMHDLVHELASVIIADESHVLDADDTILRNWKSAIHCRHTQLIKYKKQPRVFKDLPGKLRSLHFRNSKEVQLPKQAFSKSKYIRILDLSDTQNTRDSMHLPSSINKLKLLRYFDATSLPIASLPKSFSELRNMKTLIMSNCSLKSLPRNIHSLHKLCYLDLSGNRSLKKLPKSLGKLSKLSFLDLSGCLILQELPKSICQLTCLEHLDMYKCRAIQNLPDKFGNFPNLLFLTFSGCSKLIKLPESVNLNSLEHLNLSGCHELEGLPQGLGNLQNLVFLSLSECYKVSMLPESLCQLAKLKDLDLSDCHGLRELPECFWYLSELESLNLTSCSKLQLLPDSFCKLFKLKHLNLSHCMRLEKLPSSLGDLKLELLDISATVLTDLPDSTRDITTLTQLVVSTAHTKIHEKVLEIEKHLNLPQKIVHSVYKIENNGCSNIVDLDQLACCKLQVLQLQNVTQPEDAERARLRDKSDLRMLYLDFGLQGEEHISVLERLVPPRTLDQFILHGYMSKDFPNWMSHISTYLPSLTFLSLYNLGTCDNLPPFGQLPNLRSLILHNIPNIIKIGKEFYGEGGTCRKLRAIELKSMVNLMEWWTTLSGEENEEFLIPNLHGLNIVDCHKLKFLPYPPRTMFWYLDNSNMILPKGGFEKLSSSVLPFFMSVQNCIFTARKWDRVQHLSTLEIFSVHSCKGLRELPEVVRCLTSLRKLQLSSLKDLELLPDWLGDLTSLEHIAIIDCPLVTYLPESTKNLTALSKLFLDQCGGLDVLPEGIGQLTSLQELHIFLCANLTSLPESIRNLTALKKLEIEGCPILVRRCQREDAHKIYHIPEVKLQDYTWSSMLAPLVTRMQLQRCSTSEDAGASTSEHAEASTTGDAIASAFSELTTLVVKQVIGSLETSGDAGASTSGDTGASPIGDAVVSVISELSTTVVKKAIESLLTSGDDGALTSRDAGSSLAWDPLRKRGTTSTHVRASTSEEAGPSLPLEPLKNTLAASPLPAIYREL